jgi:Mrp family chromosome partitioning ATPase
LAALEAGMKTLDARLQNVRERAKRFAQVAPEIEDLERYKALQEANYTSSISKLENARVDEALDPSKIPNISIVQKPTPASRIFGVREKISIGLAFGGLIVALVSVFLIELVFDQSVKRPIELERRLEIPVLLSIPVLNNGTIKYLNGSNGEKNGSISSNGKTNGKTNGSGEIASWDSSHFIRPYSEVIRDRLGLYFDVNGLTHKPKLIAVAGSRTGAGASTLAGGLAAAFSATGDSKVLLVDMNVGRTELHPFFQGRPACSFAAAIKRQSPLTAAGVNLFLATGASVGNGERSVGLKRFYDLMPDLQTSDFDYVIFDMPPIGEMSPTGAMARFMDKFLYVVEAERSHRDLVKRAYEEIEGDGRGNVSVVLNKMQSYAPKWAAGTA